MQSSKADPPSVRVAFEGCVSVLSSDQAAFTVLTELSGTWLSA